MTAAEVIEHAYLRYHSCEISLAELKAVLRDFGVKVDPKRIPAPPPPPRSPKQPRVVRERGHSLP